MCQRPDFETVGYELDRALLEAFRRWKVFVSQYLDEQNTEGLDWVDYFACGARKRLRDLCDEDTVEPRPTEMRNGKALNVPPARFRE
jgi:hypothetical protein